MKHVATPTANDRAYFHAAPTLTSRTLLPRNTFYLDFSACLQRTAALLLLIVLSPLLLFLCFLVKTEDGGPVLFKQRRIGYWGAPFTVIKFRTMRSGTITGRGRWLRQTGLDELPQLWNILRGEMLFIGPRPLTETDIERLHWTSPQHQIRWRARPGITGLAQVFGGRGRKVSWFLDQYYITKRSGALDVWILTVSAFMVLLGKKAVKRFLYDRRRQSTHRAPANSCHCDHNKYPHGKRILRSS